METNIDILVEEKNRSTAEDTFNAIKYRRYATEDMLVGNYVVLARTEYWINDDGVLHRGDDKPAVIDSKGTKAWFCNGLRHRDNNKPAIEYANGVAPLWYLNGIIKSKDGSPAYNFEDHDR